MPVTKSVERFILVRKCIRLTLADLELRTHNNFDSTVSWSEHIYCR